MPKKNPAARTSELMSMVADCERTLRESPGNRDACYRLAYALEQLGRRGDAIATLRASIQADPDDRFDEEANLAKLLVDDGRHEEALALAQKVVAHFSESPDIYATLGDSLLGLGRAAEAGAAFAKGLGYCLPGEEFVPRLLKGVAAASSHFNSRHEPSGVEYVGSLPKYRNVEVDRPHWDYGAPATYDVATLQDKIGVALPESFLEFLRVAGGCSMTKYGFKISPYQGTFGYPHVYSLRTAGGGYMLLNELQAMRDRFEGIPREIVPFACASNGPWDGFLYLDLTDDGAGRVMAYAVAKPAWVGRNSENAHLEVANDIDEYLGLLERWAPE